MTPNSQSYQPGMGGPEMMGRMGPYEANKDPFGGMRKGEHGQTVASDALVALSKLNLMRNDCFSVLSWRAVHATGSQQWDGRTV